VSAGFVDRLKQGNILPTVFKTITTIQADAIQKILTPKRKESKVLKFISQFYFKIFTFKNYLRDTLTDNLPFQYSYVELKDQVPSAIFKFLPFLISVSGEYVCFTTFLDQNNKHTLTFICHKKRQKIEYGIVDEGEWFPRIEVDAESTTTKADEKTKEKMKDEHFLKCFVIHFVEFICVLSESSKSRFQSSSFKSAHHVLLNYVSTFINDVGNVKMKNLQHLWV
jgi:hypothetical protein